MKSPSHYDALFYFVLTLLGKITYLGDGEVKYDRISLYQSIIILLDIY